jgi:hypothetical protein
MGSEVVSLYIGDGPRQQVFTIHKKLLFGAGAIFEEMFSPKVLKAGQKMILKQEDPIAFKLFVEFFVLPSSSRNEGWNDRRRKSRKTQKFMPGTSFHSTSFCYATLKHIIIKFSPLSAQCSPLFCHRSIVSVSIFVYYHS